MSMLPTRTFNGNITLNIYKAAASVRLCVCVPDFEKNMQSKMEKNSG